VVTSTKEEKENRRIKSKASLNIEGLFYYEKLTTNNKKCTKDTRSKDPGGDLLGVRCSTIYFRPQQIRTTI